MLTLLLLLQLLLVQPAKQKEQAKACEHIVRDWARARNDSGGTAENLVERPKMRYMIE